MLLLLAACGGGSPPDTLFVEPVPGAIGAVTLFWVAPTENDDDTPLLDLAGFTIYYGTVSGEYSFEVSIDNPSISTYIVEGLNPGTTYYFAMTADNAEGVSSVFSNEVIRTL